MRPADTVVATGSSVELYCLAEGPGPTSVTWFKNGVAVDEQNLLGGGQVLEINRASASDGGTYTCSVSDGSHTVNASAVVAVVGESIYPLHSHNASY